MSCVFAPLVIAVALATTLSACESSDGGPDPDATPVAPTNGSLLVLAWEWQFQPSVIGLEPGEHVRITFENDGEIIHNMRILDLDAEVIESSEDGELFVEADADEEAVLEFIAPLDKRVYEFYCTVPDHRDLGMEGRIVILDPI